MPDQESVIHREMGCPRQEFLGWLPGATRGAPYQVDDELITVRPGAGEVQIRIVEAAPRHLGLLSLPVLRVSMRFLGLPAAARAEFLRQFDLFTRRGGG
jgi:hypothetical protein